MNQKPSPDQIAEHEALIRIAQAAKLVFHEMQKRIGPFALSAFSDLARKEIETALVNFDKILTKESKRLTRAMSSPLVLAAVSRAARLKRR